MSQLIVFKIGGPLEHLHIYKKKTPQTQEHTDNQTHLPPDSSLINDQGWGVGEETQSNDAQSSVEDLNGPITEPAGGSLFQSQSGCS